MAGWGEGRLAARADPLSVGHLLAMASSRLPQRLLSAMDSTRRFLFSGSLNISTWLWGAPRYW